MIRHSLTARLVSWYSALLLFLGLGFAAYTTMEFSYFAKSTTRQTLQGRAAEVWNLARPLLDNRNRLAEVIGRRFQPEAQGRFIRIGVGNVTLYQSGNPLDAQFDPRLIQLPRAFKRGAVIHEAGLYLVASSFSLPDGTIAVIETGQPDVVLREARRALEASLMVTLPLLLALAAIGGWVLVRQTLSPVRAMIVAAEAMSFNSPEKRLPVLGALEPIGLLGQSLNRMLVRLDSAYQHVSRFSADTAHELRTPMTIMQGELELIQMDAELPRHLQVPLSGVLQETRRLGQIIGELSTLSELGSFRGKEAHLPTELFGLAIEVVEQMVLLAQEKGVLLENLALDRVTIMADRNRLKQVLVNLIDNAIKFTPCGGRVTVSVLANQTTAVLSVADTGVGIAPEHHERIFERSYRVMGMDRIAGAGLGLAIAKSICTAHGGRITVASDPERGAVFRVELPRG